MPTFQHTRLPNGLDLLTEFDATAQSVAVGYLVKTGARDESPAIAGVSHFLEHMLFKGTARRTCTQINQEFDEMGAKNNAFTTNELTFYYANVLPEFALQALDLLSDMMRPQLREEDFELEKQVVLEEIAQYLDRPPAVLFETIMADHFGAHPMAQSVLGTHASISALTLSQMQSYLDARYAPSNLILAVAGNFDLDAFLQAAHTHCASWPAAPAPRAYPAFTGGGARRHIHDDKTKRHYLAMLCPGPAAQDNQRYAAQVLADVLGDHEGSRLFWSLVDPGLADEADFSYFPHDRAGSFLLYASCDPDRAAQVQEILHAELAKVRAAGLTPEEVARSKTKIGTATVLQGELPLGRMRNLAARWAYNHEYCTLEQDLAQLEAVTPGDLQALTANFPFSPLTITTLGPTPA